MPAGFIEPCLPSPAVAPPSGPDWVHEVKHDGYRLMARRDPTGIRLLTMSGHDWAPRYPLIVEAVDRLKVRSCLIDGEAVACDKNGLAVFERLRRKPSGEHVFLYAFDLLELDGQDLRHQPIERRKTALARFMQRAKAGLVLDEHIVAEPAGAASVAAILQEPELSGGQIVAIVSGANITSEVLQKALATA